MAFIPHLPVHTRTSARPAVHPRRLSVATACAATPKPLHDRVLVRVESTDSSSGSILLSASAKEKKSMGTVVAVAPGRFSPEGVQEPMPVQPGDRVVWKNDYGSETVDLGTEDEPLLALRVYSIIGKL